MSMESRIKKIFLLLALLLPALTLSAQSYESLWKQVEGEIEKDLPQSALKILKTLQNKAVREKNDAQLLRAMFVGFQLHEDIAPDSGRVVVAQMEQAYARERRPVERALWQSALGQFYLAKVQRHKYGYQPRTATADTATENRGIQLLRASISDIPLLGAAQTKDYMPLFIHGTESKFYKNDLLSVLVLAALAGERAFSRDEAVTVLKQVAAYYRANGNREATLLTELLRIHEERFPSAPLDERQDYLQLRTLAEEFRDLPLNVETYIALNDLSGYSKTIDIDSLRIAIAREGILLYGSEKRSNSLRNYIARKEQPSISLQTSSDLAYPGNEVEMCLNARNVEQMRLRVYRTTLTARDTRKTNDEWLRAQIKSAKTYRNIERDYGKREAHQWFADTLRMVFDQPGIYLAELTSDRTSSSVQLLQVTELRPMILSAYGREEVRVTPVDAQSGKPLTGGRLVQLRYDSKTSQYTQLAAFDAESNGNILVRSETKYNDKFWLTRGEDTSCPLFELNNRGWYNENSRTTHNYRLYTDRAIYRPGQKVHVGVIAYSQLEDSVWAEKNLDCSIRLYNSNRKQEATQDLKTDELGSLGCEFTLPEVCLPGRFYIELYCRNTGRTERQYFRVEEYKRPTFQTELIEPDFAYKLGDSISVQGKAETYTGLPIRHATVRYTTTSSRFYGGTERTTTGEAVTDDEGRFCIPLYLEEIETDEEEGWYWRRDTHRFSLTADVTAENGETQTATRTLFATHTESWLEVDWPDFICKENLPTVRITQRTSGYRTVSSEGRYEIVRNGKVVAEGIYKSGTSFKPYQLTALGSGTYRVRAVDGSINDTLTTFTLISEQDKIPFGTEKMCHYERISADQSHAFIMLGTPLHDVTLFYDIVANGTILESRRYTISDTLMHFQFDYRPEYGDGAALVFAFVRDGRVYRHVTTVRKPFPEKRLRLQWSTFRSLLRPGQQEEWRLRVTDINGTPATASLMATLYDASLEQLAANPWNFSLHFSRHLPSPDWHTLSAGSFRLSGLGERQSYSVPSFNLTRWNPELFSATGLFSGFYRGSRNKYMETTAGMIESRAMVKREASALMKVAEEPDMERTAEDALEETVVVGYGAARADGDAEAGKSPVELRRNFSETAFFHPALRTDSIGEVALVFTLPESLTSWNFRALAHDRDMRHGRLDTVVIARKEFMIETNLPRFIREGDEAVIPATLRNLSEQTERGTVHCQLLDAATEQTVAEWTQPFMLEKDSEDIFQFPFSATSVGSGLPPVLIVRISAEGSTYSDGEERYLPVLPDREQVMRTVPFSMTETGQQELRVDTLWTDAKGAADKRLVVELSSNPTWYAVAELPIIADYECYSATSWATRYYALSLARYIAESHPEIRQAAQAVDSLHTWADVLQRNGDLKQLLLTESPWLAEADDEAARVQALGRLFDSSVTSARMFTALDHLRDLQLPNGGWTWFKGMPSANAWITAEVLILLARQETMTGNNEAHDALQKGLNWMEKEISRQVKEMKRAERKYKMTFAGSELQLKYLYVRALLGKAADSDTKYLLKKFSSYRKSSMYVKAMMAIVQAHYGMREQASVNCRSLLEHTVVHPGMGRYFDTDRALWCWKSYKMPTQTAAIEALSVAAPEEKQAISEMRLWVMQAKRTQDWSMLRATTDAIYVLLQGEKGKTVKNLSQKEPFYYILQHGEDILAVNAKSQALSPETVGYYRQDYTDDATLAADRIVIKKTDEGLEWGAVYAQFTQPSSFVKTTGNGLSVQRSLEVWRDGRWQSLVEGMMLRKGERLRQLFTLTADRDYDFVSLKASRAACMEPVESLSGYTWRNGQGFYRVVRDASNEYFFETFHKGIHRFTEECFVDRSGTYRIGTAKIQSQYAPEFCGTTGGTTIHVE